MIIKLYGEIHHAKNEYKAGDSDAKFCDNYISIYGMKSVRLPTKAHEINKDIRYCFKLRLTFSFFGLLIV